MQRKVVEKLILQEHQPLLRHRDALCERDLFLEVCYQLAGTYEEMGYLTAECCYGNRIGFCGDEGGRKAASNRALN